MRVERHYLKGAYALAFIHASPVEWLAIRIRMFKKRNIRSWDDLRQSNIARIGAWRRGAHFVVYTKRGWK